MRYSLRSTDAHDPKYQITVSSEEGNGLVTIAEERLTSASPTAQVIPMTEGGVHPIYFTSEQAIFVYKSLGKILGAKGELEGDAGMTHAQRANELMADFWKSHTGSISDLVVLEERIRGLMADVERETRARVEQEQLIKPEDYQRIAVLLKARMLSRGEERKDLENSLYARDWIRLEELALQLEDQNASRTNEAPSPRTEADRRRVSDKWRERPVKSLPNHELLEAIVCGSTCEEHELMKPLDVFAEALARLNESCRVTVTTETPEPAPCDRGTRFCRVTHATAKSPEMDEAPTARCEQHGFTLANHCTMFEHMLKDEGKATTNAYLGGQRSVLREVAERLGMIISSDPKASPTIADIVAHAKGLQTDRVPSVPTVLKGATITPAISSGGGVGLEGSYDYVNIGVRVPYQRDSALHAAAVKALCELLEQDTANSKANS